MAKYQTAQRRALISFLEKHHDESFTAKQLADALSDEDVSVSAIYRNVAALESEGKLVRAGSARRGETSWRYTDCAECRMRIHLSCKHCGRTYHMEQESARELIDNAMLYNGFEIDTGDTVLYGLCLSCKEAYRQKGAS